MPKCELRDEPGLSMPAGPVLRRALARGEGMVGVVAAILVRDGRVLIAKRPDDKHLGGLWEFPGGKLEAGETPEAALERELNEELGVRIRVGRIYDAVAHAYTERDVLILFYTCYLLSGEPAALEGQQLRWAPPDEFGQYDFAPADQPVIRRIVAQGIGDLEMGR